MINNAMIEEGIHFLGAGGIGMSALAYLLLEKGERVSGSDLKDLSHLEEKGLILSEIPPQKGILVYSSAIKRDHPQLIEGKKKGLSILHRSEMIQRLLIEKKGLCVAGTHGKTSTSALLAWTLISSGKDPSYAIGGILKNLQKNGGYGKGDYFALEADESDGSFLNYQGEGAIITNVEAEHLEYWESETLLIEGFQSFIQRIKNKELLFWCKDDPILKQISPAGVSYGKSGDLQLLSYDTKSKKTFFSAQFENKIYSDIEIPIIGEPFILNALAVFGLSLRLGINEKDIRKAFRDYLGVKRRLEKIGEMNEVTIYDDYAHHPTEIQVVLKSLRKKKKKGRLIALFQPHRYTRMRDHFSEFTKAFHQADLTIITTVFSAGEVPIAGVSGKDLVKKINEKQTFFVEKDKLLKVLSHLLLPGDTLIMMGAGDITTFGPKILREIS